MTDPVAALRYEQQLATQAPAATQHEPSPAAQPEATHQLELIHSLPQSRARESPERQAQETGEDTDAPDTGAAHSKPASLGWGRLKKVKLAAKAEGSQDVGSKRKRDADTGEPSRLLSMPIPQLIATANLSSQESTITLLQ